jgi:hypothetical protein
MRASLLSILLTLLAAATLEPSANAQHHATYAVDCDATTGDTPAPARTLLHSLNDLNAISLQPGDTVLFRRGTVCHGMLQPQGSGFTIDAYGTGPLPRIEAGPSDAASLRLFNQDHLTIASLDLRGGTTYGISISGDRGTLRSINLRNLTVSEVRGPLKQKESGLVVIRPSAKAHFEDLHLQAIRAFNTTQWSGIFVSGASSASITDSIVHDVQGDGIVIFNSDHSVISHSVAWHTGMQHAESIGTPNAIWTWRCDHCTVDHNEAFLTDSPGVDGGAFDIDWGNTANTVSDNFGHDTQGYCISVFAAFGPTRDSVVSNNLCLNNGLSPRLAQRQGAILLMAWQGGSIDGLDISGNRLDWRPGGDTPALQTGSQLNSSALRIRNNEIHTTGTTLINPALHYSGVGNRYYLANATPTELARVRSQLQRAAEIDSTVATSTASPFQFPAIATSSGWRLASRSSAAAAPTIDSLFVILKVAAVQYASAGLRVSIAGNADLLQAADDWSLPQQGVTTSLLTHTAGPPFALQLISPSARIVRSWTAPPTPTDLGLALRRFLGQPDYGHLGFEQIPATD